MNHGKNICNQLKAVRRRIAEENNIALETEECTWEGECRGTCPHCEAEVRYLENALADRLRLGKVATVAGLALGLAATVQAQAPQTNAVPEVPPVVKEAVHVADSITLHGVVADDSTGEPMPFINVEILKGKKHVATAVTDWDGLFSIKLPKGSYSVKVRFVGYYAYTREETEYGTDTEIPIRLVINHNLILDSIEIEQRMIGVLDPEMFEANPSWQQFEKEGVKVIVR